MEYSVVPARYHHIEQMKDNVRWQDKMEVASASGMTVGLALTATIETDGLHFTWLINGVPGAMFGCSACDKAWRKGSPWLIGTELMGKHKVDVMRQSKICNGIFRKHFNFLENYVMADNIESVKWLGRCGYTIDPAVEYGLIGDMFHRFHWSK